MDFGWCEGEPDNMWEVWDPKKYMSERFPYGGEV